MNKVSFSSAFYKAIITTLLTLIVYQFYYIEIIRANIEDFAFDLMNEFVTYFIEDKTDSPNVILMKIDNPYLKSKNLMDENNETTYGYVFPRDQLAELINAIDNFVENNQDNSPSILFIDLDLSYPSDEKINVLSNNDRRLIEVLKEERKYKILIPKQTHKNFIESSSDPKIQQMIKDKKIIFVSTGLTKAADNISRRYYPYEKYKNNYKFEQYYPNVAVMIWALNTKYELKNLTEYFHREKQSLIENRIIFKKLQTYEHNRNYAVEQSYWDKLSMYSANYPLTHMPTDKLKDSIILLGSTHSASDDRFATNAFIPEISGIEMHANALMTLFYFDGKLNRLTLGWTALLVFTIVFIVSLFMQIMGLKYIFVQTNMNHLIVWVSIFLMIMSSLYFLLVFKIWFNWLILSLMTPFSVYLIVLNKIFKGTLHMIQAASIILFSYVVTRLFNFKKQGE